MFTHFTLVLESELSNVLESGTRAASLLNLSIKKIKKNQPKSIIKTRVTVPNVQKCVMVATLTLYGPSLLPFRGDSSKKVENVLFLFFQRYSLEKNLADEVLG